MSRSPSPGDERVPLAPGPTTLSLTVPSDTSFLHLVTNLARNSAIAANLSESDADKLALATDEAMTNVIEHAYHGQPGRTLEIVVQLHESRVEVHIIHDGDPIDPSRLPADLDLAGAAREGRRGGLGVFLMRRLVDRVDFRATADHRNECCLIKGRNDRAAAEEEDSRARGR